MADMSRMMCAENGPVLTCKVQDCSYNQGDCCHARTIEVGDEHPTCDTYTHDQPSGVSDVPLVATCHVDDCFFNQLESCHAAGITVGFHSGHADCITARMT